MIAYIICSIIAMIAFATVRIGSFSFGEGEIEKPLYIDGGYVSVVIIVGFIVWGYFFNKRIER